MKHARAIVKKINYLKKAAKDEFKNLRKEKGDKRSYFTNPDDVEMIRVRWK